MESSGWFGVRCIFRSAGERDGEDVYEERVTIWSAATIDDALNQGAAEAAEYARDLSLEYLGLAQAYAMADHPRAGAEVFSLTRRSSLPPGRYLDTFFDTGAENQSS